MSKELSPIQKKTLGIVFFTIFLDLVGFAIIFPLIPQLTSHYSLVDSQNIFMHTLWNGVDLLTSFIGSPLKEGQQIVLFGCLLGAIYSLLQFFAAPFWGKLSDRIGRKKIMLTTLSGMVISYLVWIFSASFSLLILSRLIGGLFSGNLSVATAIVADITTKEQRSKGMALIGIAFALGFVFGPAMGGLISLWDMSKAFPEYVQYGINPFSSAASLAFFLSLMNLLLAIKYLPETKGFLEKAQGVKNTSEVVHRTANLFKIFSFRFSKAVNQTNFSYFLFIALFAGMEFTITFMTVERLAFTPTENGLIFVFIGFLIALVQGGFVRRRAHIIGEKKVALLGLILLSPGLLFLGYAQSITGLLIGLTFLSFGSAMVVPTLTSMVSLLTSENEQGEVLGIFRSLGALGRILGPLWASLVYWRFGSFYAYLSGALLIIIPIFVLKNVHFTKENSK